jgi:hypothetical protein
MRLESFIFFFASAGSPQGYPPWVTRREASNCPQDIATPTGG